MGNNIQVRFTLPRIINLSTDAAQRMPRVTQAQGCVDSHPSSQKIKQHHTKRGGRRQKDSNAAKQWSNKLRRSVLCLRLLASETYHASNHRSPSPRRSFDSIQLQSITITTTAVHSVCTAHSPPPATHHITVPAPIPMRVNTHTVPTSVYPLNAGLGVPVPPRAPDGSLPQ